MKKRILTSLFLMAAIGINAQQLPVGPGPAPGASTAQKADFAWYRGGNNSGGPAGVRNIFGTRWNSPVFTVTSDIFRMRLNGNVTYPVNGYNQPRNGYLLLGQDGTAALGNLYGGNNRGAFSLLHLNGAGTFVQEGGYRNWMQTGITFTSNNDLMYVGHRQVGTGTDKTEAVLQWSDNAGGGFGPDVMSFRFTGGTGTGTSGAADLLGGDNDGREIFRMMGSGNVGIGPRFSNGTATVDPQSRLHQHSENAESSWYQITNQYLAGGSTSNPGPTPVTAADGLRLGIMGHTTANANGVAMLYNQELRPLLFSTNANTTTATVLATQERVRIMSYSTPTVMPGSIIAPNNPSPGTNPNATRVSISHNPGTPLTRPLSLLHLGYNNDFPLVGNSGHRPWMDVGTFTSQAINNTYVGLKTGAAGPEAAINFGGNTIQVMRFTHTQPTTMPGTPIASTVNGLEIAEMWSNGNEGRTGFGGIAPQNTVHIKSFGTLVTTPGGGSGLRFANLTSATPTIANPGLGLLAVDANGDVVYVDGALTPGSGLGNACASVTPTPLASSWEIPMGTFNFRFADPTGTLNDGENFVGIGTSCTPAAKLEVIRGTTTNSLSTINGARIENSDLASNTNYIGFGNGVYATAKGNNRENAGVYGTSENGMSNMGVRGVSAQSFTGSTPAAMNNIGVMGEATEGRGNIGVSGKASTINTMTTNNRGGSFEATNSKFNYGVYAEASSSAAGSTDNIGTFSTATTSSSGNTVNNIGVVGIAKITAGSTATNSIGVYGDGFQAGYFTGVVWSSQPVLTFSDKTIKTNVNTIENGLTLLNKLNPVTYDYKDGEYPELHLSDRLQYGFIAQEVEQVIPELVSKSTKPELKDAEGNVISKGGEYKGINYDGLIPVLTKSVQEQQAIIEKLIKEVAELKEIAKANPANTSTTAIASVELSDVKSIVLDQNTPNPFAEQTSITYNLTDGVQKAQMLFYNVDGKLINSVDLETKQGRGQLNVFASDLSNGMYTYTLVVDGVIIDTKRMVKSN